MDSAMDAAEPTCNVSRQPNVDGFSRLVYGWPIPRSGGGVGATEAPMKAIFMRIVQTVEAVECRLALWYDMTGYDICLLNDDEVYKSFRVACIPHVIDVINVQKIIINVNKRVYSEKDSKRL